MKRFDFEIPEDYYPPMPLETFDELRKDQGLLNADVIVGVQHDDNKVVFYGLEVVKELQRPGRKENPNRRIIIAEFAYDDRYLEEWFAFILALRGHCCYKGNGEQGTPCLTLVGEEVGDGNYRVKDDDFQCIARGLRQRWKNLDGWQKAAPNN